MTDFTHEMYRDLSELLIPGFLSTSLEIDGHRYGLRSLSQQDIQYVRKHVNDGDPLWKVHLVAHSVWVADGLPLLGNPFAPRVVFDHLLRCGKPLFRAMLGTVYGFFVRMQEANAYLEAYLYEEESRRVWRGLGSGRYPLHSKTSIPGVDALGLNPLQSAWVTWNKLEDDRDAQEYIWSNTKVMVSLQSHKGYESLQNKDKTRQQNEDGRRGSVKERARNRFLYGDQKDDPNVRPGNTVRKARTADELEDEMRRWIAGELDWHDQIVEAYKNRIRQEQEERERQKEEVIAELRAKRLQEQDTLGAQKPALRPITAEEMEEIRRSMPTSGAKFITEADPAYRNFNRFIRPTVQAGNLSVDAAGRIVEKPPAVQHPASLDEQIAGRKVVVDG